MKIGVNISASNAVKPLKMKAKQIYFVIKYLMICRRFFLVSFDSNVKVEKKSLKTSLESKS